MEDVSDMPTTPSALMTPSVSTIGTPRRMAAFFSADCSAFGIGIRYFTRPGWLPLPLAKFQHVGFVFEDRYGHRERHEALYSEGWHIKRWDTLRRFAERPGCRVEVIWLDTLDPSRVADLWRESCSWEGRMSYDATHIIGLAILNSLFGRAVLQPCGMTIANDPHKVFCSEGCARLLFAFFPRIDLRKRSCDTWDSVTPNDARIRLRALLPA